MYKAVLWDFGGVVTTSPFAAFRRYEAAHNLPKDFIRTINATNSDTNAWAQLESNRISVDAFDLKFAEEAQARGHRLAGKGVLALLSGDIRPDMVRALAIIKQNYIIGCITNNVKAGAGPGMAVDKARAEQINKIMAMFETVIESSRIGIRKPDPRIYAMACKTLNLQADEVIYLDDLGINLKPAKTLGMTTIKVVSSDQAIDDLEALLKIKLRKGRTP